MAKLLRACNLYRLILPLMLCLTFSSNAKAKTVQKNATVTFSSEGVKLREVFREIKKQTGYSLMYSNKKVPLNLDERVSVKFNKSTISDVMEYLLRGRNLQWQINDESILILPRKMEAMQKDNRIDTSGVIPTVSGKVTDAAGLPLIGATVQIRGSEKGTTTDPKGEFHLSNVNTGAVLLVSNVGYETRDLSIKEASIPIKLNLVVSELDETVVIAYGTTTKRLSTGNIATVKAKDISTQPVNNPLLALQGRVPGLFITQNTGVPGGGINIQIRGQNSITNGYDPLYVIDGVPYTSQLLPNRAGGILQQSNGNNLQGGGNPLSFINLADIESISVLKDADATAIYGSRGANGVVLITTKRGKSERAKAELNLSTGISKVARKVHFLSTQQYLQMRREAFKNDGIMPDQFNAPDLLIWDTTRSVNWQDELIGGAAKYTDIHASVSGGSTNTQYLISGNFHKETTVFPGEFSDQKGSLHYSINNTSVSQKFKVALSGSYMVDDDLLPTTDLTNFLNYPPNTPIPYNADGNLNWAGSTWPGNNNPFSILKQEYKSRTNNLVSNLNLLYHLLKGLEVKANFGYTNMQVDEISRYPASSLNPDAGIKTGNAYFTNNSLRSWIIEPQITYQLKIGRGSLEALIGTTFQQNTSEGQIAYASGYTSDALLENIQAAPSLTINSVTNAIYKYHAIFGRLNYNLLGKYILNLTARKDGSSRFGDNNKFHTFGSVGATWIFSQESLAQKIFPFLSFGKLRASIGTTGNDQIGDYRFYDLFNTTPYSYQGTVGLTPLSLYNPDLAWEETRKLEGGIELSFFKDRILLNVSYYHNRSSNQLLSYTLPSITGFPSIPANFPATVQNTGWEFLLSTINIQSKDFSWASSINFSIPRNKLISFPNLINTPYQYSLIIGQPIGITKAFHLIGVNDTTGVYEFTDNKGNRTYNPVYGVDNTIAISTAPRFYGGFSNTINYKGFQLDFIFQFTKQLGVNYLLQNPLPLGSFGLNGPQGSLDRWTRTGVETPVQRFTQDFSSNAFLPYQYAKQSDYAYSDASFIRLKNLSISYQLPVSWTKKMRLQSCRIYMHTQNLFTITSYKGIDPENQAITALPPLRVVTGGIELVL